MHSDGPVTTDGRLRCYATDAPGSITTSPSAKGRHGACVSLTLAKTST